ncbi:MAG: hypothetical protein ACHP7N_05390 [Caulobacterales bacterium]
MSSFSRTVCGCWLVLAALLAGGARAETANPPPTPSPPVRVTYSSRGAGMNDIPVGAYRVPDSNVLISGHQKGGAVGLLFGPVGILAQSAINSQAGKQAVSGARDALRFDVPKQAEDETRSVLQSGRYGQIFTLDDGSDGPQLTVYAYASITFVTDTDVRPYVILKAVPKPEHSGDHQQTVRYICCAGEALPLAGDNGLTANGGALLQKIFAQEVDDAVNLMLTDAAHSYTRDEQNLVAVDAHFPFVRNRLRVTGYELSEDRDSIVFAPKLGSLIVFSGVEKMDKASISYRPATKKDAPFNILPN